MPYKKVVIYELIQEKMIKFTDIDYKFISNDKAKDVLGRFWHVPAWRHVAVIEDMKKCGYLRRKNQKILEIKSENC